MRPPLHTLFTIREIPDYQEKVGIIMNIFEKPSSFIGDFNTDSIGTVWEVLSTAKRIRQQLGKQAYLLDSYLSLFWKASNHTFAFHAADNGNETSAKLRKICYSIINQSERGETHPFYEKAVTIFRQHKGILEYQEKYTQVNLLYLTLADEYLSYAVSLFIKEQKKELSDAMDLMRLRELYVQLSDIVEETQMESLNILLKQHFLIATPIDCYIQGLTNELLYCLLTRDMETDKRGFQLALDNLLNDDENS